MSSPPELAQRRVHFEERTRCYAAKGYDRVEAARFVAAVLDPTDGPVLDVGTGKGLLAVALAARGASVVTVDPDAAEQELAALLSEDQGVSARLHIVTGDAASLPYADGHFSAAASMDVLHHLEDPAPILQEMVRTLAPHGELLLADFSHEGMDLVAQVHREEGREHPNSGVTVDSASAVLQRFGLSPVVRLTRHLHDIAVFARKGRTLGQDTLDEIRRASHPNCLVCGRENPDGLQLAFTVQPDRSVHATFQGGAGFQGYPDTIHGGLIATLLDAAMTNCLFARGVVAVTARLNVRYLGPASWYRPSEVTAKLHRSAHRVYYLTAEVRQDGRTVARAAATFSALPRGRGYTADPRAAGFEGERTQRNWRP